MCTMIKMMTATPTPVHVLDIVAVPVHGAASAPTFGKYRGAKYRSAKYREANIR